jgi:Uma2 family endonuclease
MSEDAGVATTTEPKTKTLLTGEQFMELVGDGPYELVRGEVIEVSPGNYHHGITCSRIVRRLGNFGEETGYGYTLCNDFAVRTERDPDTVRGADVASYSHARLPFSASVPGLPEVVPDLVVEVYAPSNRRSEILGKVHEYLNVGVLMVWVVHPGRRTMAIHRPGDPIPQLLSAEDVLENLPELPGLRCAVADLFG